MAYESSMTNIITKGYTLFSSSDEQTLLMKALRTMRDNVKVINKFLVGDSLFQKSMDTTALSELTLTTSAATATSAIEAFEVNTFVNAGSSSNYTVDTTGKLIKATDTAIACVIVSNSYTITQSNTAGNYVVLKIGTPTATTGTAKYSISRDGGTTFAQIYPGAGVFIGSQPTGTSFVFKVEITGDYQLVGGIGFSIR